jgi:nitrogen-specific signal transduction histidine kinase
MSVAAQAALTIENSRLFERVRERDRLAALGEMSAGLAHEIRNPLGAIKGAAQLVELSDSDNPDPEMLRIIIDETNRLNTVVSQFLHYARPVKSNPVATRMNQVIEKTCEVLKADNPTGVEINLELGQGIPEINSEPEQLMQVFINLGVNAIQVMKDGGVLSMRTYLSDGRGRTGPEHKSFIRIDFKDTGPGIPEEVLNNIFIPFYTTKDRGTGLGLAISQRIIKNLGGTIEVNSRVGEGTTFSVLLPSG